jgi:NADH dehydrogenase
LAAILRSCEIAAGVKASPLGQSLGVERDRAGRVIVNPDLSIPGRREIFVIGDLASVSQADGRPVPGLAPATIQEGRHAAGNVMRAIRGEALQAFRYWDKGTMAAIGRGAAVADIGRLHLSGLAAWIAWLLIHILYLAGFRNRLIVLAQWAWFYLRNEPGARLITGDLEPLLDRKLSEPHGSKPLV